MKTPKNLLSVILLASFILAACQSQVTTQPAAFAQQAISTAKAPTSQTVAKAALKPALPTPTPSQVLPPTIAGVGTIQESVSFPVNPDRSLLYAFNSIWLIDDTTGAITRWDPEKRQVQASIQVGDPKKTPYGDPVAAVATADGVWVTAVATGEVVRIDPTTNQIAERIPLGQVDGKSFITNTMIGDGQTLWVWDYDRNITLQIDPNVKKVVATIPNFNPITVADGAVWGIDAKHFDLASPFLLRLDPKTAQVIAKASLTPTSTQQTASADSFWMKGGLQLFKIDPQTNQVIASIDLGTQPQDFYISGGSLWVTASPTPPECHDVNKSYLARIDLTTNQVIGKIGLDCPYGILTVGDNLWVFNGLAPQATIVQPAN